ncbi:MAG: transposase [Nitrososphaeraceae archaeon]
MLDCLSKGFTAVSLDESFFFFDSLVRKVWIYKNSRPVVTITGSHRNSCMFGAISLEGKQLFRQYERFNEDTFYGFLKHVHHKFPKCYLFLDKAPQHYRSHKVRKYFKEHKDTLIPVYLPTASPEFMVLEECWNVSKNDLLVLRYYPSFAEFRTKIGQYFRTKHFNMNVRDYLTVNVSENLY